MQNEANQPEEQLNQGEISDYSTGQTIFKATHYKVNRYYMAFIAGVLLLAVLKITRAIIVPIVISFFLVMLLMPVVRFLTKYKVPLFIAVIISMIVLIAFIGVFGMLFVFSLSSLQESIPKYSAKFESFMTSIFTTLKEQGIEMNYQILLEQVSLKQIAAIVGKSMMSFLALLSNLTIIFFITLLTLLESRRFKEKTEAAYGGKNSAFAGTIKIVGREIQRYIFLKTVISLATGLCVWIFLAVVGVKFALLWGILTFLLNYIPNIGSIIAGVPPLVMTMLQFEHPLVYAVIVLIGLLTIQIVIGNLTDPKVMGKSLNISTPVVFIAMIFWGWMWGIVGMFLSVPLLVCVKAILAHSFSLKPVNVLLEG